MILWLVVLGVAIPGGALAQSLKVGVLAPSVDEPDGAAMFRAVQLFEEAYPQVDVVVANDVAAFANADVAAVVGHLSDEAATEAAAQALKATGVPFLSATTDQRSVARLSDRTYTASYTKDVLAQRIAAYAAAVLGAKRVVLLHADDEGSLAVARAVKRKARAVGIELVRVSEWSADDGPGSDYLSALFPEVRQIPGQAAAAKPRFRLFGPREPSDLTQKMQIDAFLIVGNPASGAEIVGQLRRANLDVPVIGTDAWDDPSFVEGLGDLTQDVYVPAGNTWEIETFEGRKWREAFGPDLKPTDSVLFAYEALQTLAAAADQGAADPDGVAAFLAGLRGPDGAVEGLSSLVYFDEDGVMQREPWFLRIHRGKLKPAFTQLRKVVDPRELWRATRGEEAAAPVDVAETTTVRRGPARIRRRLVRPDEGPLVEVDTASRTVDVGGEAYHLTSVVYAGIDFFRVNDIDVEAQSFDLELYLWFMWEGDVDIDNIGFLNQIYTEEGVWEVLREDLEGEVKYVCYKIKARFLTPYDLRQFPFDGQTLPLTLSHATRDSDDLVLVVDYDSLSTSAIREIYPEEWTFLGRMDYSAMYDPPTTFGDPAYEGPASRSTFSVYQTEIHLKRILFPYLITLFMPLGIMVVISLFVVVIPPTQFDARLTLTMTALLSVVVFHLAQQEGLPSVGYLMRSDQYFMITYVLLFVLIVKTLLVNMVKDRVGVGLIRAGEALFALLFLPVVFLAYIAITFGNPLAYASVPKPVPAESEEATEVGGASEEGLSETDEAAMVPPEAPPAVGEADEDPHQVYVMCKGQRRALGSIVAPILEQMEKTEIPYTQSKAGGDELRDCSGNFLRVSSWVASACPEAEPHVPASAGVTRFRPGGDNVFKGAIKSWTQAGTDGTDKAYEARTSRSTARWYQSQGLYVPVFADSGSQKVNEPSADLLEVRNQIRPGTVMWFAKPGARITKAEGLEKMFSPTSSERITHVGVVHSVERDADGNVVSYKMYHGRRAYGSSDPEKQDNKITEHEWDTSASSTPRPPLGNWTEPLVGIAPIVPAAG